MLRVFGAGDDTFQTNFPYFGKATALDVINFFGIDDENIISDKTTFVSPKDNLVITENFETLSLDPNKVIENITKKTVAIFITHAQGFNGLSDKLLY